MSRSLQFYLFSFLGSGHLFRHEKILGEWPLVIYPLRFADKSGIPGHLLRFFLSILMTTLGPDSFAFGEYDR